MGFLDLFKKNQKLNKSATWKEFGTYNAVFSPFGSNIFQSMTVRETLRPLAEHTSKANARCKRPEVERILNERPNIYMNGKAFLAKSRNMLELKNTLFIAIFRDEKGALKSLYPIPYQSFEAVESNGRLFIMFQFLNRDNTVYFPWEDLAVIRNFYNSSDIAGDDNSIVTDALQLLKTTNQGISNAVKATANLRGILKSTKAMLSDEDIKKQKDRFVEDYLNLENEGGIASLDSTQEFTPITMNPTIVGWEQRKQFEEDVHTYFGVSESIIKSNYDETEMEAFYDSRIEPFLIDLSLELTTKIFTQRERAQGARIIYESNRMQFASVKTKLAMVSLVDRGALTPNEWRLLFNLAPVEGGDVPIRMLNTDVVNAAPVEETEGE